MIFKSQCLEIQSTIRVRDIFISGVLQSIVPGISVGRVVPSFMMIMVRRTTHFVVQFFEWLSYSDFFTVGSLVQVVLELAMYQSIILNI